MSNVEDKMLVVQCLNALTKDGEIYEPELVDQLLALIPLSPPIKKAGRVILKKKGGDTTTVGGVSPGHGQVEVHDREKEKVLLDTGEEKYQAFGVFRVVHRPGWMTIEGMWSGHSDEYDVRCCLMYNPHLTKCRAGGSFLLRRVYHTTRLGFVNLTGGVDRTWKVPRGAKYGCADVDKMRRSSEMRALVRKMAVVVLLAYLVYKLIP